MTFHDNERYDAIISGAGPVGLFLACELALAQCSVLVLEKTEDPTSPLKRVPFGIRGLSAPTIDALHRRGLLRELQIHKRIQSPHQHAGEGPRRQAGHFAGIPFHDGDIDATRWTYRLPGSTPTHLLSEMEELESVLARRAETLGVRLLRGAAVTGFHQTGDGVAIHSHERTFEGQWLVGCDGSRSAVRKLGGFEFAGTEPEFTGYTAKVDIADPKKLKPGRNMTPHGMYLQSQPGHLAIQDFDGGAFHATGMPITREHVQDVLRRISGTDVTIDALHIATTWTDRARQATAYRKGRVFLAGDAAHIHSPLGGQGLNLGLGDAMNLGWKLAATIKKHVPHGLLDSYHAERHPIGERILDWSRAQVAIMRPEPHARALNGIVRDLMKTRDGATYFAGKVWGLSTRYPLGDGHPLLGSSVPEFEFEDGRTISDLMHDGRGVLLDFAGTASLERFAGEYGGHIVYVTGHPKESFELSALLIRPDGFIAWASEGPPDIGDLHNAAARWFTRGASS
ncbi:2-polyprenyl-6-methoxyphenol hydroxylase-like FAD-dependent oxidoreductase [Luteibacter jiangsuensis]|uniref:2-polyprenyl-6-methoxyphenol hydroxylase-like FAD-dependent oxidoreductase n=1 Tax=Luteibacter jiangsuensis TaxID=637577 RepID=A0ABT9ST08_9GAMM|nr:FAD-dependent monooxygenase [Luteibacter jiangsuensis]MDQ0008119.1 2-polyprenyl-6-methoxyphenol hydroxylase-like FAD-dependent oxidoreductase [Luteibacter jiangsuensis]